MEPEEAMDEQFDQLLDAAASHEEYETAPCGCLYCFCVLRTDNGEPCDDCMVGAHQG